MFLEINRLQFNYDKLSLQVGSKKRHLQFFKLFPIYGVILENVLHRMLQCIYRWIFCREGGIDSNDRESVCEGWGRKEKFDPKETQHRTRSELMTHAIEDEAVPQSHAWGTSGQHNPGFSQRKRSWASLTRISATPVAFNFFFTG